MHNFNYKAPTGGTKAIYLNIRQISARQSSAYILLVIMTIINVDIQNKMI